jgi:hypothetical protein
MHPLFHSKRKYRAMCGSRILTRHLELQHIYFSIIAFKFQKEPTAKQKERADAAKAKKENALKGKKE